MKTLPCQITGIFSRSPGLVRATRDFDRGRCSGEELEKIRSEDVKKLISLQEGFQYISDGNLLWQDLFRPFTKVLGIEPGSLTRFFETNTFYRKPLITSEIKFTPNLIDNFFYFDLLPENSKVILPGPFTFATLSENLYYKNDFLLVIGDMLAQLVSYLKVKGIKVIQFSEPSFTYFADQLTEKKLSEIKLAYEMIVKDKGDLEIYLHTYFGDFRPIRDILKLPVDGIDIDFIATPIEGLNLKTEKKVGIGCLDATNSLLENKDEVVEFVKMIIERLNLKRFFLCPNCDFDFLPYPVAEKKIKLLRDIAGSFT